MAAGQIAAGSIGTIDKDQVVEEPDEPKGSRPVLKPSGGGDSVAYASLCGRALVAQSTIRGELNQLPRLNGAKRNAPSR